MRVCRYELDTCMRRRELLTIAATSVITTVAGCASGDDPDVGLTYTIRAEKEPEEIPEGIRKSRGEGGRRKEGNTWVVVTFEVTEGTLDMEDVWFRSRVETSSRFHDLDHGTADLSNGVQSRGEITQGGEGIALYQIPEDADTYEWNLEDMQQDVEAEKE